MSDSDDIITKLDGTTLKRSDIVNKKISYYNNAYTNDLTNICDLSTGSEIRTLIESMGVEDFQKYVEMYNVLKQSFTEYSTGYYLDMKACEEHLTRKSSEVATGTVTFTLSSVLALDYTIPAGTIILHRTKGTEYILSSDTTIKAGTSSSDGLVYAKITGSNSNALDNTLTAFQDVRLVRRDITVTNTSPITGGLDAETDEQLRQRILDSKKQRAYGTITAYKNLLSEINGVHDVQFVNPNNTSLHFKEDGVTPCYDCTRVCFINATTKPCPDTVFSDVQEAITNQDNLVIGHLFHPQKAVLQPIYLHVSAYTSGVVTQDELITAVTAYINGGTIGTRTYNGLNIVEPLKKVELINAIEEITGIEQVDNITRLRYNPSIAKDYTDISKWTTVAGTNQYTYTDSAGYTYTRESDPTTIDVWGKQNFTEIDIISGTVITFGQKTDLDPAITDDIGFEEL